MGLLDEAPLNWQHPESNTLLHVLLNLYQRPATARHLVASVGLDQASIHWETGARELWVEIINHASNAGCLRRLVLSVVEDPGAAAYKQQLQQVLDASGAPRPTSGTMKTTPNSSQVRILFLAANPTSTSRLDLEEELRTVELELGAVTYRDRISLVAQHAIRPDDLVRYVRKVQPTIVHFSGHASSSGVLLRSDVGGQQAVSGDALQRLFQGRGVDLVVLNACSTESQARAIHQSVPTVVGTSSRVSDEAARRFSCAFYRSLGNGLAIREAFRDGGDAVALHGLGDVFCDIGNMDRVLVGPTLSNS